MTTNSIWATFSINGLFFVGLMLLFEHYRTRVLDLYAPKSRGNNPKFDLPREGFLQWVKQLYEIDDEKMFTIAGMDGYMFLRFLLFCCKLMTICSVPCALILIPVYATAPSSAYVYNFEVASMANINHNGHRLWAPFVCAYLFTFVFLYLIHKEYENFIVMRKKYIHGAHDIVPLQTKYTVQVENIPDEYRSSQKLYDAFNSLFPGDVLFAHVICETPELDKLVAERDSVRDQLEKAIAVFEGNGRTHRPLLDMARLRPSRYNTGHEVDSITYLTRRLHRLCQRVARLQKIIIELQGKSVYYLFFQIIVVVSTLFLITTIYNYRIYSVYCMISRFTEEPNEIPQSPRPVLPSTDNHLDDPSDPEVTGSNLTMDDSSSDDSGDEDGDHELEEVTITAYNPLAQQSGLSTVTGSTKSGSGKFSPVRTTRKFAQVLQDVRNRISEHFMSTTGFVTFQTRRAQMTAVKTTILFEQFPYMTAGQAPPPEDVIWANLGASNLITEEAAFFSAGNIKSAENAIICLFSLMQLLRCLRLPGCGTSVFVCACRF